MLQPFSKVKFIICLHSFADVAAAVHTLPLWMKPLMFTQLNDKKHPRLRAQEPPWRCCCWRKERGDKVRGDAVVTACAWFVRCGRAVSLPTGGGGLTCCNVSVMTWWITPFVSLHVQRRQTSVFSVGRIRVCFALNCALSSGLDDS